MKKVNMTKIGTSGQRGATLVIALVILLVMSMIGVANMETSTMQERMAANSKQRTTARIAAESALNAAEEWLNNNVRRATDISLFNGANGLYSAVRNNYGAATPVSAGAEAIADITVAENWENRGFNYPSELVDSALVSSQPKFIIEFLGRDTGTVYREVVSMDADGSARRGEGNINPYLFRITAIGWGKDANIYTVLESTYRTGYGPGNFTY